MAKRKNSRRRRRISGVSTKGVQSVLMNDVLPIAGGYFGVDFLVNQVAKSSPDSALVKYARWGKIIGGALLASSQKGIGASLGIGIAANGVVELVSDAMNGVGAMPFPADPYNQVLGVGNQPTVDTL